MSGPLDYKTLENEHLGIYPRCEALCKEVSRQLEHLIDKEGVRLAVPIQFRAKTFPSILDKVKQGRFTIRKSILELQDLSGLRIITLFKRDAVRIIEVIDKEFEIFKRYNAEEKLNDSEFGYSSVHLIGRLSKSWLTVPTLSNFQDLDFEIQVRTLSQHSWAEASNIFQYKSAVNVPKPLKRSIGRISALLETIDLEFERLLSERIIYKEDIKHSTQTSDEQLNVDLLEEILDQKLPAEYKDRDEDYSSLLNTLKFFDISTVESVVELIDSFSANAIEENDRVVVGFKKDYSDDATVRTFDRYSIADEDVTRVLGGVYFNQMGLVREMLNFKLGRPWTEVYRERTSSQ